MATFLVLETDRFRLSTAQSQLLQAGGKNTVLVASYEEGNVLDACSNAQRWLRSACLAAIIIPDDQQLAATLYSALSPRPVVRLIDNAFRRVTSVHLETSGNCCLEDIAWSPHNADAVQLAVLHDRGDSDTTLALALADSVPDDVAVPLWEDDLVGLIILGHPRLAVLTQSDGQPVVPGHLVTDGEGFPHVVEEAGHWVVLTSGPLHTHTGVTHILEDTSIDEDYADPLVVFDAIDGARWSDGKGTYELLAGQIRHVLPDGLSQLA